jgi:hypothetical protein
VTGLATRRLPRLLIPDDRRAVKTAAFALEEEESEERKGNDAINEPSA